MYDDIQYLNMYCNSLLYIHILLIYIHISTVRIFVSRPVCLIETCQIMDKAVTYEVRIIDNVLKNTDV